MSDAESHQLFRRRLYNANHINGFSSKSIHLAHKQVSAGNLASQLRTDWTISGGGADVEGSPGTQIMPDGSLLGATLAFCSGE